MRRPGDPCERSPRSGRLRNWFRTRFYFSIFSRERRSTTPKYPSVWAGEMAASDEGDGTGRSDGREVPKRRTTPWAPHLGRPEILKSKTWSEGLPVGAVGWDPGAKWPRMAEWWPKQTGSGPRFNFQYSRLSGAWEQEARSAIWHLPAISSSHSATFVPSGHSPRPRAEGFRYCKPPFPGKY